MRFIQPQKPDVATYAEIIGAHKRTFAEIKEDGYRFQLHKKGDDIKAYSSSGIHVPFEIYPEIYTQVQKLPDSVLECELIGEGRGIHGFRAIKNRFRVSVDNLESFLKSDLIPANPLRMSVFDVLHWEGKNIMKNAQTQRRKYVEGIHERKIQPSAGQFIDDAASLEDLYEKTIANGHEGLVCKNPNSIYKPGSRCMDWVKLKRYEPVDAVIVGVYTTNGKISHGLCAIENNGTLQTVGKVNLRMSEFGQELADLPALKVDSIHNLQLKPNLIGERFPEYFVRPQHVIEVRALNIGYSKTNHQSCGLSDDQNSYCLRIGVLHRTRPDKNPSQITTKDQIAKAYALQEEKKE